MKCHDDYNCPTEPHHPMYIEGVTICDGYADFLRVTMPYMLSVVDRLIVGTSPQDEETRDLCRQHHVQCILSTEHRRRGFNKGRLIERCLQHTSANGWRLHVDSDIVLPHRMRHYLVSADLDPQGIYGVDRVMIHSRAQWERFKASDYLQHHHHSVDLPRGYSVGGRWAAHQSGYVPIGFFQLWNSAADEWRGSRIRRYPESHGNACRTDVQFGLQWDRRDRHLLPEIAVVHLESEAAGLGVNWNGRKTKRF
jgi:hypothetical protein